MGLSIGARNYYAGRTGHQLPSVYTFSEYERFDVLPGLPDDNAIWFTDHFIGSGSVASAAMPTGVYTANTVGAGSGLALVDGVGGIARLTTDANTGDGVNLQANRGFDLGVPATHLRDLAFNARLRVSDPLATELFIGFAARDSSVLAGVSESLGLRKASGSALLRQLLEKATTETESQTHATAVLAADQWIRVGCYFTAIDPQVVVTVNGVAVIVQRVVTNLPTSTAMYPTVAFRTSADAAKTLDLDWLYFWQGGR